MGRAGQGEGEAGMVRHGSFAMVLQPGGACPWPLFSVLRAVPSLGKWWLRAGGVRPTQAGLG